MMFVYSNINTVKSTLKYVSHRLYLNEFKTNLAANLERSPLMHSDGYASAGDRPTLFARFALIFVPFIKHAGAS